MEDKKQREEGTVDFSGWELLPLPARTWMMLACERGCFSPHRLLRVLAALCRAAYKWS